MFTGTYKNSFNCRKCLRLITGIDEDFFNKVYKDEFLCVTCRSNQGKRLTKFEENGLLDETAETVRQIKFRG